MTPGSGLGWGRIAMWKRSSTRTAAWAALLPLCLPLALASVAGAQGTPQVPAPQAPGQPAPTQPAPTPGRSGITTEDLAKTAEDLARQAGDAAKSVGGAIGGLWNDVTGMVGSGNAASHLPAQISDEDRRFFAILDAIGLRLKEVSVSKGVLSSASYRFEAAREPTEADIARAEELLRAYRTADDGLRSRARQKIVRSALDTVSTAGYVLSGMEVTLTPWPDASYQITAKGGR